MLQVNFIMIFIIHKILVILKITRILKHFLRSIIHLYFLKNNIFFFSQPKVMEIPSLQEENIIKYVRNLFRLEKLKKETNDTTIKDIRNIFRLKKEKNN